MGTPEKFMMFLVFIIVYDIFTPTSYNFLGVTNKTLT